MIDVPARVKDALREGNYKKNYIFNVLNDDGTTDFTIDNDTLVSESVKIDERMCTGNDLKFGLCEGSSLEFQYFDHPNITGRQIQAFIEVEYVDEYGDTAWHTIPMGFFTVDQCPMQFSTGIRKVTAYNKLKSAYLDQKANELLLEGCGNTSLQLSLYDIQTQLLADYQVVQTSQTEVQTADHLYGNNVSAGFAVKFTSSTSDGTPINPINLAYYSGGAYVYNNTFYLAPVSFGWRWPADPTKYYIIKTDFDVAAWETNFISYLTDLIDDSLLNKSSSDYFDWIKNTATGGWRNVMAIEIRYSDNTKELYSDAAYARGIATGTFRDIVNRTIVGANEIIWYQATRLDDRVNSAPPDIYDNQHFDGGDYIYKTQDDWDVYPSFKFPDGSDMPTYAPGGHVEPVPYWFHCYELDGLTDAEKITFSPTTMADFTLRDIISANYETVCEYGKLDRLTDMFSGVALNNSRLVPADTLYPDNALYPGGNSLRSDASMYQKLWTDSQGVQTFRYLIITYKTTENGQEVEKTLQRTVNADGTTDYYMSDNWLFKNLVWTAEDVGAYADAMVLKMQNVSWFPFEMWCAGLPYIETGDELEITNSEGTYTSYVLQRQLNGIQNLQDTFIDGELDIF